MENSWEFSIGLIPGILFGSRAYVDVCETNYVIYLGFIDICFTIYHD